MSTPNPEVVNKESSFANIEHAILVNSTAVAQAEQETVKVEGQAKQAVAAHTAQEQSGGTLTGGADSSSLLSKSASTGSALSAGPKNHHANAYGNMALDSVGLAGVGEMVGMLGSVLKGETSFRGVQTLEGMARAGRKGRGGKAGASAIETDPLSDRAALLGRSKASGAFNRNSGKPGKWNSMAEVGGQFTQKIQQTHSVQLVSKQQLGNALQAKAVKGAHYAKAVQAGLGQSQAMQLVNSLHKGPKGPSEDITSDKQSAGDGMTDLV